jgi:hypothetical protein
LKFSSESLGKTVLIDPTAIVYVIGDKAGCKLMLVNNESLGILESIDVVEKFLVNSAKSENKC